MQKQKKYRAKIFSAASVALFAVLAKAGTAFGQWDKTKLSVTKLPSTPISTIIANLALWLLGIFGFVAVIGFVISGITYFLAAGDEDRQETAKRAMIYSITGVLVGLAGLVIIYAVDYFLGGSAGSGNIINSAATGVLLK